jgi:hypothetical protein
LFVAVSLCGGSSGGVVGVGELGVAVLPGGAGVVGEGEVGPFGGELGEGELGGDGVGGAGFEPEGEQLAAGVFVVEG